LPDEHHAWRLRANGRTRLRQSGRADSIEGLAMKPVFVGVDFRQRPAERVAGDSDIKRHLVEVGCLLRLIQDLLGECLGVRRLGVDAFDRDTRINRPVLSGFAIKLGAAVSDDNRMAAILPLVSGRLKAVLGIVSVCDRLIGDAIKRYLFRPTACAYR
jgi:hypothetical protein